MKRPPLVIKDNQTLFQHYDNLQPGDLICCRIRLKPGEEHLLLDLSERNIQAIPSLTSQLCSRSKAFQTRLYRKNMIPETTVIYSLHDLLKAIGHFGKRDIGKVVLKQEGKNGGLGVFLFNSIEEIYTQTAGGLHPFPYVIQPFVSECRDLRVIIIDEYVEVYERINQGSFRQNLHCGGISQPCKLTEKQYDLCRRIMNQGGFPYAHIDLMVKDKTTTYFTEINLRGGLRGASITSVDYRAKIEKTMTRLCEKYLYRQ